MDAERRIPRAQPAARVRAEERLRRLRRAHAVVDRRSRGVLGRDGARPACRVAHAVHARARQLARHSVDDLVDGRPDELRRDGSATRRRSCRDRRGGRGGHRPHAHVPRALGPGRELRRRAALPWRQARRPGGHLPPADPRVRGGGPRGRRDRRRVHPDLLRIRRRGDRRPPPRCRGQSGHLRRRLLPARPDREDEGGRGRGGGRRALRRHRDRRGSGRPRVSKAWSRRRLVGRHARRCDARHRRHLRRGPVHGDLHLRHDRQAEGRAARARRLPDQGRAGSRPLLRSS